MDVECSIAGFYTFFFRLAETCTIVTRLMAIGSKYRAFFISSFDAIERDPAYSP